LRLPDARPVMMIPQELPKETGKPARTPPPVTRERVHARTRELASLAGRACHQVTRSDYERAKREITGERLAHRQEGLLDSHAFWRPDPIRW
jgi:hypothetical protein